MANDNTNLHSAKGVKDDEFYTTFETIVEELRHYTKLHDLGQLWAYCKLCDPAEAFLLSSSGMGSLNKILNNLRRIDLLDFGDGRRIKKCK